VRTLLIGLAVSAILVGCSSGAPKIDDPKQIVEKAATNLAAAQTFHLVATVDGTVAGAAGALGGLDAGQGTIDLSGVKLEGDFDTKTGDAQAHLAAPALLGLTADMIQKDGFSYLKTSLTGDKWQKSEAKDTAKKATDLANDPATITDGLEKLFARPGVVVTKLADDKIDGADVYHVRIAVPAGAMDLGAAAFGALGPGTSGGLELLPSPEALSSALPKVVVPIDLWVDQTTLRPVKIGVAFSDDQGTKLDAVTAFSAFDKAVTVTVPPADQVTTAPLDTSTGGFPFPSGFPFGILPGASAAPGATTAP